MLWTRMTIRNHCRCDIFDIPRKWDCVTWQPRDSNTYSKDFAY